MADCPVCGEPVETYRLERETEPRDTLRLVIVSSIIVLVPCGCCVHSDTFRATYVGDELVSVEGQRAGW